MALNILKPTDPIVTKYITMVIFGESGVGKTSLAFTAKNPLVLDFDSGVAHIKRSKGDVVQIKSWEDIESLTVKDMQPYDTIVIDTAGRLIDSMIANLLKVKPSLGKDGIPNQRGWGELKAKFNGWKNMLLNAKKDIVFLSHMTEDTEDEKVIKRLDVVKSGRDELRRIADQIGYMWVENNNRTLDFNPANWKVGKNRGEVGKQVITKDDNNVLETIIETVKNNMNALSEQQIKDKKNFDEALDMIANATSVDDINGLVAVEYIAKNASLKQKLHEKATKLGLKGNKETKQYEVAAQ